MNSERNSASNVQSHMNSLEVFWRKGEPEPFPPSSELENQLPAAEPAVGLRPSPEGRTGSLWGGGRAGQGIYTEESYTPSAGGTNTSIRNIYWEHWDQTQLSREQKVFWKDEN